MRIARDRTRSGALGTQLGSGEQNSAVYAIPSAPEPQPRRSGDRAPSNKDDCPTPMPVGAGSARRSACTHGPEILNVGRRFSETRARPRDPAVEDLNNLKTAGWPESEPSPTRLPGCTPSRTRSFDFHIPHRSHTPGCRSRSPRRYHIHSRSLYSPLPHQDSSQGLQCPVLRIRRRHVPDCCATSSRSPSCSCRQSC